MLLVLVNGADGEERIPMPLHHLCHLKCNKSLIHEHFVFDRTWAIEQIAQQKLSPVIHLAQYVRMCLYGCIVKERTAITEEILTAGSSSSLCNHLTFLMLFLELL